ncbi:MAG TPA: DUF5076 domain-containing protein [Bauldia sp.]|nr:DUF5076 domain-containing protein [Bauldia sp.]
MPKEQPIPPDVLANDDAVEVLRAFVADGGLSISFTRAFDDPSMWGMLLVDIARHAARVFEKEGVMSTEDALERIRDMFESELANPTDMGVTSERKRREH